MANSDLVVIAKVAGFQRVEGNEDSHRHDVSIAVDEVLKQEPLNEEPYRGVSLSMSRPESALADWKERACPLLIGYDELGHDAIAVIELKPDGMEVMTADVELIRDRETVIRLFRKAAREQPRNVQRTHTFNLSVPRAVIVGTSWETYYDTGGHLQLAVPADERLEKRAQAAVRSEDAAVREEGARALNYFKTDENLALLKPLLADPGVTYSQRAFEGRAGKRFFGVRNSAYRTLKCWGVEVKEPVVREEVR